MKKATDGNTAVAYILYALTEVAAIYPIIPSSTMAELVDEQAESGLKNIYSQEVQATEMQSEVGATGVVYGSLRTGALTATYTASQGLLLMIPSMYKTVGELLPSVFHVAARVVTTNALGIFGDHGNVMATRQTGFCILVESSVQEITNLSAVVHLASLEGNLPFVNFFDGFRTSHELQKIEVIGYDDLKGMMNQEAVTRFRMGGMNPNYPIVSGIAQNPDTHFRQRETVSKNYEEMSKIVQKYMKKTNNLRGTTYNLIDCYGVEDATEATISMGSVSSIIEQAIDYLNQQGRKVGFINTHLYCPFPTENLFEKLPATVEEVAVLD